VTEDEKCQREIDGIVASATRCRPRAATKAGISRTRAERFGIIMSELRTVADVASVSEESLQMVRRGVSDLLLRYNGQIREKEGGAADEANAPQAAGPVTWELVDEYTAPENTAPGPENTAPGSDVVNNPKRFGRKRGAPQTKRFKPLIEIEKGRHGKKGGKK
jgi:hypothetical protein